MKKVLSLFICLLMVFSTLTPAAVTASATTTQDDVFTILAASDFQTKGASLASGGGYDVNEASAEGATIAKNLMAKVSASHANIGAFLFGGDFSHGMGSAEYTKVGYNYLHNALVEGGLPNNVEEFYITGNHENGLQNDASLPFMTQTGGYDMGQYGVYCINHDGYPYKVMDNNTLNICTTNTANLLDRWLDSQEVGQKPIFVMSHLPLHYSTRTRSRNDALYAQRIVDVLNNAANRGLNIIFLYGHNHSGGYDNFMGGSTNFATKGDSIWVATPGNATAAPTKQTIQFTYMNYGYLGYYETASTDGGLTMTVFEVREDDVTIRRYDQNGEHALQAKAGKFWVTSSHDDSAYGYQPDTKTQASGLTVYGTTASADQQAANQVIATINKVGTVGYYSAPILIEARAAYNALSDSAKALVSNHGTLHEKEVAFSKLAASPIVLPDDMMLKSNTITESTSWQIASCSSSSSLNISGVDRKQIVSVNGNSFTAFIAKQSAGLTQIKASPSVSVSGYAFNDLALKMQLYVSDVSGLGKNDQFELSSSGTADTNEIHWTFKDMNLKNGWNTVYLEFSEGDLSGGQPNLSKINYMRMYFFPTKDVVMALDNIRIVPKTTSNFNETFSSSSSLSKWQGSTTLSLDGGALKASASKPVSFSTGSYGMYLLKPDCTPFAFDLKAASAAKVAGVKVTFTDLAGKKADKYLDVSVLKDNTFSNFVMTLDEMDAQAGFFPDSIAKVTIDVMLSGQTTLWLDNAKVTHYSDQYWRDWVYDYTTTPGEYSIAVIPDIQELTVKHPDKLNTIMQWLVDNKTKENLQFVVDAGDVTWNGHSGVTAEFQTAANAFKILQNAGIDYSISYGNHDVQSGRNTTLFNQYFPLSTFKSFPSYGGAMTEGKSDNTYYRFEVQGNKYMVVALELDPQDTTLEWASQVIAAHPDHQVIVSTHNYMYDQYGVRSANGENMWSKLISKHQNIFLVLCGHECLPNDPGSLNYRWDKGVNGNVVHQLMTNSQDIDADRGGVGLLMMMRFRDGGKTIDLNYFSPVNNGLAYKPQNQFSISAPINVEDPTKRIVWHDFDTTGQSNEPAGMSARWMKTNETISGERSLAVKANSGQTTVVQYVIPSKPVNASEAAYVAVDIYSSRAFAGSEIRDAGINVGDIGKWDNGGKATDSLAAKIKSEGLKQGWNSFIVPVEWSNASYNKANIQCGRVYVVFRNSVEGVEFSYDDLVFAKAEGYDTLVKHNQAKAATMAIRAIPAVSSLTLSHKSLVEAATTAYNAVDASCIALVKDVAHYTEAKAKMDALVADSVKRIVWHDFDTTGQSNEPAGMSARWMRTDETLTGDRALAVKAYSGQTTVVQYVIPQSPVDASQAKYVAVDIYSSRAFAGSEIRDAGINVGDIGKWDNGGKATDSLAAKLKSEGLKKGWNTIIVPVEWSNASYDKTNIQCGRVYIVFRNSVEGVEFSYDDLVFAKAEGYDTLVKHNEAKAATMAIRAIPAVSSLTASHKSLVDAATAAYNAVDAGYVSLVKDVAHYNEAKAKMDTLV